MIHTPFKGGWFFLVVQSQFLDIWLNVEGAQVSSTYDRTTYSLRHENLWRRPAILP